MNKLIYAEMIKHIDNSVIKPSRYYAYSTDHISLCAINPASKLAVYFCKNASESYRIYLHETPFADEAEKLFKYAEKRYNEHFKNAESAQLEIYEILLKSNAKTHNR